MVVFCCQSCCVCLRQSMMFKSTIFCCCLIVHSAFFAHTFLLLIALRLCCVFVALCVFRGSSTSHTTVILPSSQQHVSGLWLVVIPFAASGVAAFARTRTIRTLASAATANGITTLRFRQVHPVAPKFMLKVPTGKTQTYRRKSYVGLSRH